MENQATGISRREFLKKGGMGVGAVLFLSATGCGVSSGGEDHTVTANLMVQHPGKKPQGYPYVRVPYCTTALALVLAAGVSLQMDPEHPELAVMIDGRENRNGMGWELWIDGEQVSKGGFERELQENSTVLLRYAEHAPQGADSPF